jgi:myo-inositol-1(or 4)-monophosphatase
MPVGADLQSMLALATRLAVEAGQIARTRLGTARAQRKVDGSDVTDVDVAIETYVLEALGAAYPQHAVLSEEGVKAGPHGDPGTSEFCWVIDPLDGTRNYVRKLPIFCTSIAVLQEGVPIVAVVHAPTTGQTFTAIKDGPARVDAATIRATAKPLEHDALLGVPTSRHAPSVKIIKRWADDFILRNLGSTALHMAWVASGALDGAFCVECKLWDIAAGALLVERAGGICTRMDGSPIFPFALGRYRGEDTPFLAGGTAVHGALLESVRELVSGE